MTKVSLHKEFILVETDTINLADLRNVKLRMYYVVEIHDVDSEEIGCIMEEIDGVMQPVKYDTFSKAKVQAALVAKDLPKGKYVHIESMNDSNEC